MRQKTVVSAIARQASSFGRHNYRDAGRGADPNGENLHSAPDEFYA